jgi:radical SAM superfamily enzyme YgiQ (UPF0313 family)
MDQRIAVPRMHILTPVPGTPLWDEMEAAGRITSDDYKLFTGSEVIFKPRNFDQSTLSRGFWQLSEQVFSWTSIRRRMSALPQGIGVLMRGFILGSNLQYRGHVQQRISPGIV